MHIRPTDSPHQVHFNLKYASEPSHLQAVGAGIANTAKSQRAGKAGVILLDAPVDGGDASKAACITQLSTGVPFKAMYTYVHGRKFRGGQPSKCPKLFYLLFKAQPFTIGTIVCILNCSWHFKLPGHLIGFVWIPLSTEICWITPWNLQGAWKP